MSQELPAPAHRVSPVGLPAAYRLPPRPAGEGVDQQVADARRQSSFVLGEDVRLFERGMNLQMDVLRDSHPVRYRTHALAALVMQWSRAYAYERDAFELALHGSYISALPLLRAAAECLAAQMGLHRGDLPEFEAWLGGVGLPQSALHAVQVPLGRYRSSASIADDARLGPIYRATADLANTHFGSSLLQVGPESNQQKLALAFGDRAFHLGWAEVVFGWALGLVSRQLTFACEAHDVLNIGDERRSEVESYASAVAGALERPDRCAIMEIEHEGERRLLVHNFRRAPGSAGRRILL